MIVTNVRGPLPAFEVVIVLLQTTVVGSVLEFVMGVLQGLGQIVYPLLCLGHI